MPRTRARRLSWSRTKYGTTRGRPALVRRCRTPLLGTWRTVRRAELPPPTKSFTPPPPRVERSPNGGCGWAAPAVAAHRNEPPDAQVAHPLSCSLPAGSVLRSALDVHVATAHSRPATRSRERLTERVASSLGLAGGDGEGPVRCASDRTPLLVDLPLLRKAYLVGLLSEHARHLPRLVVADHVLLGACLGVGPPPRFGYFSSRRIALPLAG
jgi:hypothetical protein